MRNGPDVASLASPGVVVGTKIDVVRGRDVLELDIPAENVILDATKKRDVPELLTFDLPLEYLPESGDYSAVAAGYGQRSHVWAIVNILGTEEKIEIGWFRHDNLWKEAGDCVRVTAYNLLQDLVEDPMLWPSSPARGATLKSELQRLARNIPVVLDGVSDSAISTSLQWNRSRVAAIQDLCLGYGLGYRIQPDGYLHVYPLKTGREPQAIYTVNDLLLDAPRFGDGRKPNYYTALGEMTTDTGTAKTSKRWSSTAAATEWPYDPANYGTVRQLIEVQSATSQSQVTRVANLGLRDSLITTVERSLEIVPDPRIELDDVIGFVDLSGTALAGRVIAYSTTLDGAADTMRVDVEVLLW